LSSAENKRAILFVIDGLEFGGGERLFLQLASKLRDRYHIFVATDSGGEFAHELRNLEIEEFSLNMTRQLALKPFYQIGDIIRHKDIQLVHSQGARADFFGRLAGRIAGVPHIVSTIQMPVEGFDVGFLRKMIYRLMDQFSERYVDRFIVVSESLRKTLTEGRGISNERVVKIYNGIELDKFHPDLKRSNLRKQWGIATEEPVIGAIGRLVWQKGFEYLIEAMPEILQDIPQAKLLLVGDGPLRHKLEGLAQELNVYSQVIFAGFRSDIQDLLSMIDILSIPSLLEGFPMITLEAMAMAKPIVATQIEGIVEQISDSDEGILVPPKDAEVLASAILRLIKDRELGNRLGAAARSKIERYFSIDKMVKETEMVYLSLLEAT
jgi:glycosyltransferase involved in cell wall biosynthesis